MSGFKGDYLGFTFNGIHSSDLGIVRTSDGSRFNENLLPTIQDKTVQVPGGDGTYFFGSYYTQRQFSVPFAFDELSETQLRQLKKHFGDKQIHDLAFDETPYKTYQAKATGTAQIKHLVFDEGEGKERVYKGSGTIQFTCYWPYALCSRKWQSEYTDENKNEWAEASGLLAEQGDYDKVLGAPHSGHIKLYNPGDIDTHFRLSAGFAPDGSFQKGSATLYTENEDVIGTVSWKAFSKKGVDEYVVFDTQTNLVEGFNGDGEKTGNLYNQYVTGAFFKIPQGKSVLRFNDMQINANLISIEYNYQYI